MTEWLTSPICSTQGTLIHITTTPFLQKFLYLNQVTVFTTQRLQRTHILLTGRWTLHSMPTFVQKFNPMAHCQWNPPWFILVNYLHIISIICLLPMLDSLKALYTRLYLFVCIKWVIAFLNSWEWWSRVGIPSISSQEGSSTFSKL